MSERVPTPRDDFIVRLIQAGEQFKDVWTSLVSSHEIFASDLYLLLII
jgi:hypothetical protein